MSTFIQEIRQDLAVRLVVSPGRPPSPSVSSYTKSDETSDLAKNVLRGYFAELHPPQTQRDLADSIDTLRELRQQGIFIQSSDEEQQALQSAIITKIVIGCYLTILEQTLDQARRADVELEWWLDIERSRRNLVYYLLQSEPHISFVLPLFIISEPVL
jgi:nuclear control of ATPase protein 2